MKADFDWSQYVGISMVLFIIFVVFFYVFLNVQTVQAGSYSPPKEKVECTVNSDCSRNTNGFSCLKINDRQAFCGCLSDDLPDCRVGFKCKFNRCVAA